MHYSYLTVLIYSEVIIIHGPGNKPAQKKWTISEGHWGGQNSTSGCYHCAGKIIPLVIADL